MRVKSVRRAVVAMASVLVVVVASGGSAIRPVSASASIVVTSSMDGPLFELGQNGVCDLREAIQAANSNIAVGNCPAGTDLPEFPDVITFAIPGTGPHTIRLVSELEISQGVTIDGSTAEAGAGCLPRSLFIELTAHADWSGHGIVLTADADKTTIKGLVINGFGGIGISAYEAEEVSITCSHIGTNIEGTEAVPNFRGVTIGNRSALGSPLAAAGTPEENRNVISGNTIHGVSIIGSSHLYGNYIGTNLAGTAAIPNGTGIEVASTENLAQIGSAPGEGNVISGNTGAGIVIYGGQTLVIANNYIGTGPGGIGILGNGDSGVVMPDEGTKAGIVLNVIANNAAPQIDLGDDGPTANDPGDNDEGPNDFLNYPTITSVSPTAIAGNLNEVASGDLRVDIYHSETCGYAETWVGNVQGLASGNSFTLMEEPNLTRDFAMTGYYVATVTDLSAASVGQYITSEFSPCFAAAPANPHDVDCDGEVTTSDALAILNSLAGLEGTPQPTEPCDADVNGDESVTLADAIDVRRAVAGLFN